MNKFEKFTQLVKEIYFISNDEKFGDKMFGLLKQIIDFNSGYIFFLNPDRLEYSYNPQTNRIADIKPPYLKENLEFKNSIFGVILLSGGHYTDDDKKIFSAAATIISNIIKDIEITKVIKMQIEALQQGYTEVREHSAKIKEADEIKTKFLSHITHELRTPLNAILGFSELLGSEFTGSLNNKQKEYVNDIKISGINLLGMINEILDMSKIEAGAMKLNRQKFKATQAVDEVLNTISPLLINKNIKLSKFIEDIEINSDYQKFQQILFNLLGNAVKFTPEQGKITINVQNDGKNTVLSVKDNGIGIDKKFLKKIFKPFEQNGKSSANSTGLGLAITKELVNLHNGNISVKSEPSKGAEFIVTLPQE